MASLAAPGVAAAQFRSILLPELVPKRWLRKSFTDKLIKRAWVNTLVTTWLWLALAWSQAKALATVSAG